MAKEVFDNATNNIGELTEEEYKDSTTIMQLISKNLTLWTFEISDKEDY